LKRRSEKYIFHKFGLVSTRRFHAEDRCDGDVAEVCAERFNNDLLPSRTGVDGDIDPPRTGVDVYNVRLMATLLRLAMVRTAAIEAAIPW
jgi:hypothetical protein